MDNAQELIQRLNHSGKKLSKSHRRIAECIVSHYDKVVFMTASKLGEYVGVSESTVVRFAVDLGFDGYPSMQKAMQEMVLNRLTSVQRIEVGESRIAEGDVLTSVLQADTDRIRTTLDEIDRSAFEGAVEALLSCRRIYILGVRSSSALAYFLSYYFHYMFDDVRLLTSASDSEMLEQIVRISPSDVLIGISFPRYSSATVRAMEYGRKAGATTIALTDCVSSPLARSTDYPLCAKSGMVSLVDSMVAPMSVINALVVCVAKRRKQETAQTFEKLERIWDACNVYEKIDG